MMNIPPDVTGPVNIGNPAEFAIRALAEMIIELTSSSSKIIFKPLPSDDPKQRRPDITKARAILGWDPKTRLRDGLVKTIAYFDKLLSHGTVPALAARNIK